jgi:3D (Asp-Asp-Asp) domain-containing protein
VLGQAHTPKRRLVPFALLTLAVLVAPAVGGAGSGRTQAALRAQDARIAAQSRASVLSLYSLDQRLADAHVRLGALVLQARTLSGQQAELRHALAVARGSTKIASQRLAVQLRALYEQGDVEPIEIVFGAKSLDDALTNLDGFSRASDQSKAVLRQLEAARAQLRAAAQELAKRRAALEASLLQARATARALEQDRASRSAFISSLAAKKRLTESQLSELVARAQAASVRSTRLAPPPPPQTQPAGVPQAAETAPQPEFGGGGRTLTVTATGYSLGGSTATGLPVGWGVAAVDPGVIPLGTHMSVPGYGEAVAADTGGAVVGATIDLWFPTTAQAMAWGRRTVTISLH